MDLRISDWIVIDQNTDDQPPFEALMVDPYDQKSIDKIFSAKTRLPQWMRPRDRWLLSTEEVEAPTGTMGLVSVRSTWARLGIVSPLTNIDPGFKGTLTISAYNASHHNILIRSGDSIWSMVLFKLARPKDEPIYAGRYQGQAGLQTPKALKETST